MPDDLSGHDIGARTSMFCVDTPLDRRNKNNLGGLDLGNIISAVTTHARWLEKSKQLSVNGKKYYHLIVIRSTGPARDYSGFVTSTYRKVFGFEGWRGPWPLYAP